MTFPNRLGNERAHSGALPANHVVLFAWMGPTTKGYYKKRNCNFLSFCQHYWLKYFWFCLMGRRRWSISFLLSITIHLLFVVVTCWGPYHQNPIKCHRIRSFFFKKKKRANNLTVEKRIKKVDEVAILTLLDKWKTKERLKEDINVLLSREIFHYLNLLWG